MELVGRDSELEALVERLREKRLVTVTGPGGIGKSALARAAVRRLAPSFPLGAIEVDLTRSDRLEAVRETVAAQLGFTDFLSLVSAPGDQPVLLLFDNCEHVLDAAADAVQALLDACEMPVVLATSRSPLDLPGEGVLSLAPLAVPEALADDAAAADALALFRLRARDNGVALAGEDVERAAELCRRLDGVPLALEIAAARLRSRTMAELLEEVRDRPHALARPRFRGKPGHRSVAELVGDSCALLGDADRETFARLGVFAGPFTAEMAHAVASPPGEGVVDMRERLASLTDASLLVADTTQETAWYRLLHPVRAVALDTLRREGGLPAARSRLVDHAVTTARSVMHQAGERWKGDVVTRLLSLYGHLTAALRWAVENDAGPDRAFLLLTVLWGVVHQAHTAEVREIGEQALARWDDPGAPSWADACATVATCRSLLGESAAAIALAESALPHARAPGFAPATLPRVLAHTWQGQGDLERAAYWFREALAGARDCGIGALVLELEVSAGLVAAERGDLAAGLAAIERAEREATARGGELNAAWARAARGSALARGGRDEGVRVLEDALGECRALGYPAGESFCLRALGLAHLARGDERAAAHALLAQLGLLTRRGSLAELPLVLDGAADLLQRVGHPAWADLAATALALPLTTLASRSRARLGEEASRAGGVVLSHRDAFVTCRSAIAWTLEELERTGPSPARPETGAAAASRGAPGADGPALVAEGDVWRIDYRGTTIRVKDSKGLRDLAVLLAEPGRSFPCLDLMQAVVRSGDRGEVIDAAARRAYEERVRDLRAELSDAEAMNDPGRAERARAELDALVDELARASGLGGRTRRAGGDVERARSAVTQRLRGVVKRLDALHPELASHLRRAVATGSLCRYEPDDGTEWVVRW